MYKIKLEIYTEKKKYTYYVNSALEALDKKILHGNESILNTEMSMVPTSSVVQSPQV